jgi:hypothetical protein
MSFLLVAALAGPALAEDAPEFLLGDLGVRLDLSRSWRMTRWSDWDFNAELKTPRDTVLLFVWATPVQVPITTADGWGPIYEAKVGELGGVAPKVSGGRVAQVGGRPVAFVDVAFELGKSGDDAVLRGATLEIANQDLHIAAVTPARGEALAERELKAIVEALDFRREPEPTELGATVKASGITTTLPEDWRLPLESEMAVVTPVLGKLGIDDPAACWLGVHPRAGGELDVMAGCQGGLLLGVVDEHSFEAVDPVVRQKMFGAVEVAPAELVRLADRVGFEYTPREGLAVGVVPYDQGVARYWVVGEGDLSGALGQVMAKSTFTGPHPAGVGDQVSYWLTHRTTSPVVLCPLLGVLGVGGVLGAGVIAVVARGSRRNRYDLDDE